MGDLPDNPAEYARELWARYRYEFEDMDFQTRCFYAQNDLGIYRALQSWAWSIGIETMSTDEQVALAVALIRKPPRGRKGETMRRNDKLLAIANRLRSEYPELPITATGGILDILSEFVPTVGRDRLLSLVYSKG